MKTNKFLNGIKRFFTGLSIFIVALSLTGLIYQTAASEADKRNFPAPGNLIDVGGFKMHIYCMGEGSPTVILETLSGGTSSYWGWIQPEIGKATRVCIYDRAGRGWSQADPQAQSLQRTVHNLHTLLANAGIDDPYVLVGHSIGGIYVRQFAANYPDDVVGLVLLDSAHPEQFVRYPELLRETESYLKFSSALPVIARFGIPHLYFALGGEIDFAEMTEPQKSEIQASWSSPDYFESQRAETLAAFDIYNKAQRIGSFGDLPLIVISQSHGENGWAEMQSELASLSSNSLHMTVEDSTHVSLIFNPQQAHIVSQAILHEVNAIQTGARLNP